jgi:hypothetical protein
MPDPEQIGGREKHLIEVNKTVRSWGSREARRLFLLPARRSNALLRLKKG